MSAGAAVGAVAVGAAGAGVAAGDAAGGGQEPSLVALRWVLQ